MGKSGGTTIQAAPTTPAPNPSDTASAQYEARLKYDPQVAQMEQNIQNQMVPQQTALYSSLYNQYYPQLARQQQALQQELFPQQSQLLEAGAGQAMQRLQNPFAYTPQEQMYQDQSRNLARENLSRQMRERANLGGGLYGGRQIYQEGQALGGLEQSFAQEDINRRLQAGQIAQNTINPYLQILYPQIGTQQPQINPMQYQSAVPSADTLYNAYFQASQPQYFASQKPDRVGQLMGLGGQLGGAGMMALAMSSERYKENIKLWGKHSIYLTN